MKNLENREEMNFGLEFDRMYHARMNLAVVVGASLSGIIAGYIDSRADLLAQFLPKRFLTGLSFATIAPYFVIGVDSYADFREKKINNPNWDKDVNLKKKFKTYKRYLKARTQLIGSMATVSSYMGYGIGYSAGKLTL